MFAPAARITLVALAALLLLAIPTQAQNSGDGTVYSRFGVGELETFGSPQVEALGGRGIAHHSYNYVNFLNPASFSDQLLTRVAAGAQFQALREESGASTGNSQLYSGSLSAVQFSLPLYTQKLGLAFGFVPYARTNYLARRSDALIPSSADTLRYDVDYEGRGGLQQIVGGGGYRISDNFSVGASVHFVFGIIEDARRTQFEDPGIAETNLTTASRLFGVTGTLGAVFSQTELLGSEDRFDLGVAFTLPTSLSGTQVRTIEGLSRTTRDTLALGADGQQEADVSVDVPLTARAGISYQPDARWLVLLDGEYEPWSGFDWDATASDDRFLGEDNYSDRYRVSGGVEFLPAGNDLVASFLARTAYRLGAYHEQGYVSPDEDITLSTTALTGGFSLPTLVSGTRIDLNMEVGTRGTTDEQLVRDVFYKVSLNLNIGERWFRKRRFR